MKSVTIRKLLTIAGLVALSFPFFCCENAPPTPPLSIQNSESYSHTYGGPSVHKSCVTPPCG